MITYLIKTVLCSAFFLLFYKTILAESKSYKFNRIYLIAAVVLSFIIPVLPMPISEQSPSLTTYFVPVLQETEEVIFPASQMEITGSQPVNHNPLLFIYLLITGILLCRSFYHIYILRKNILHAKTQKSDGATLVFSDNISSNYTFLNYIFIKCNQSLPEEIINHEMTHVRQKHTLDILFIELLLTFCWFNPILLLYRKYIALNHEYLADENVLKTCTDEKGYMNILLSVCSSENDKILIHQFNNYKTIKKRVKMIMKTNSKTAQWLRFVAVAPLFVASLFLFSGNSYSTTENPSQPEEPQQVSTAVNDDALYKEYMQIIEKYMQKNDGSNIIYLEIENEVSKDDLNRMKEIFLSLTPEQQLTLPYIFKRHEVPAKKNPTAEQFESWKDPSAYGLWINGKKTDNSELNKYQYSDITSFFVSRLMRNAKDYGKYVYHLSIETNSHYQAKKAKIEADTDLHLMINLPIIKKEYQAKQ
jgi:Antirepressor regulating drug resistance, predicted signal transduction N-terminal membrane component